MIFYLALIAFVVFLVLSIVFECSLNYGWVGVVSMVASCISGISVLFMLIAILICHVEIEAEIEANKQRYDSLVYQAEARLYENDNDVGKKDLANQIQEWNEDLAINKALQNDFWVGIFIPNIYDEFEFIPMSVLSSE